jgi:hypothetical protein
VNDTVSFFDLFTNTHYVYGAGYGIRIYFDVFGIRETLLRIDLAKRLDDWTNDLPFVYFSLDHAF